MSYLNWHVGMKVVCVDPRPIPDELVYGEIYTISWIGITGDNQVSIDLVEIPAPEDEENWRGYVPEGFKPVKTRKTDISIFTRILSNPHVRIREDA